MRDVVSTVLLVAGVALVVLAGLGVLLMRDALERIHYLGLMGPAACCAGAAVFVHEGFSLIGDKALLLGAFLLLSSPALAHVTARAIRRLGARSG
jgi:multicomponent Na+:H+ antiporter subunit G